MGKRYTCDYCGKTMVATPAIVRTHNNGLIHQKLVQEHYQQFKGKILFIITGQSMYLRPLKVRLSARATETVQTRYRAPGKRHLKEQAGFLVSRSLALPSAPP